MTMVSSGPISLGGTATTSGLNQSVNVELGRSGTASINMNESAVRTLAGVPSGAITMNNFYGKANQFSFTVSANTTNFNLRSAAVSSGWNQNSRVVCTINSGVTISSTSTGTAACTINGSFPGGVEMINNGTILGAGGAGGGGNRGGASGGGGGLGLLVQSAVTINNVNRISGGGGGGGGGGANSCGTSCFIPTPKGGASVCGETGGSGGGGGIGNGAGGSGAGSDCGGPAGNPGSPGSLTSGGAGGPRRFGGFGGAGGTYGSGGSGGQFESSGPTPAGAGGAAVSGNSNITWIAFGTRNGAIT
jgi:hypothetical protein